MGALYILYMEGTKTKMTTASLEAIAQLKADYFKKEAEKVDALNKKKMDNTSEMREGLLYALRRNPTLLVLEPFAKWDQRTDEYGEIPMTCGIEVVVPEHAPIYVLMQRGYRHDPDKAIVWDLGNNQSPRVEIQVWARGLHTVSFYRHTGWELGEILALAEQNYVDYFHYLEMDSAAVPGNDKIQATVTTGNEESRITPTRAELALIAALRDLAYEMREE